jgi:hypothetical protein
MVTLNLAPGKASLIVPSTSIDSCFAIFSYVKILG